MDILHTLTFADMPFSTDAQLFSSQAPTQTVIEDLLYAQQVVESQWLGDVAVMAVPMLSEIEKSYCLFEDVRLIHPECWDIIDESEAFLLNRKMLELGETNRGVLPDLESFTMTNLVDLFDKELFIVVGAGRYE